MREIGKYNIQQRGKNYPCRKRNTFPSSKDKKFLLWRAQKIPCQHRGFPVSERFGNKKIQEFCKFFLQCTVCRPRPLPPVQYSIFPEYYYVSPGTEYFQDITVLYAGPGTVFF
jgi:hypothetical protein